MKTFPSTYFRPLIIASLAFSASVAPVLGAPFATFNSLSSSPLFELTPAMNFESRDLAGDTVMLNWLGGAMAGTSVHAYLTVSGRPNGSPASNASFISQPVMDLLLQFWTGPNQTGTLYLEMALTGGTLDSASPFTSAALTGGTVTYASDLPSLTADIIQWNNNSPSLNLALNGITPPLTVGGGFGRRDLEEGHLEPFVALMSGQFEAVPEPGMLPVATVLAALAGVVRAGRRQPAG